MALGILWFMIFTLQLRLSFSALGNTKSMESVPDLQNSMYVVLDNYPCVRLLNLSGDIGCSNPGREKVVAPIIKYKDAVELTESSAILMSMGEIESFFERVSADSNFAHNVGGVLVESTAGIKTVNKFSPAQKFPQAVFAPYNNISYKWNPNGSDLMWKAYNYPVFLLSEGSTLTAQEAALKNVKNKKASTTNVAEFDLVMQTTKAGTPNSESCLKEETCLPLGGYSVWSSVPPINTSSSDQSKPVIMAVASMDSSSFFRDKSIGAESSISGLISLLAAIDALSKIDLVNALSKQLVFVIFTGEAWGYLGSRRFLHELDLQSEAVHGLNKSSIEMVLEIGSVGKSDDRGLLNFFAHSTRVSSATNETWTALKRAQESLSSENFTISQASSTNPGIPPSSLMAFLRKNSLVSGIVLEDFDSAFSNKFYSSHLDDLSNINSSAITSAASLVARTLYVLAAKENLTSPTLSDITVNVSLVEELISCLLNCDPGLSCSLVKNYISPTDICPNHYVGVILDEPSSTPYSGYVNDVSRFVWNFLADKTSIPNEMRNSICSKGCGDKGEVCIKAETEGKGVCVLSTTRYVPAYSTRLKFESGVWKVLPPNSSDPMGMVDPVWTESNWNTVGLRVYTMQKELYDNFILFAGIAITVLAYFAIVIVRSFITKALKID